MKNARQHLATCTAELNACVDLWNLGGSPTFVAVRSVVHTTEENLVMSQKNGADSLDSASLSRSLDVVANGYGE